MQPGESLVINRQLSLKGAIAAMLTPGECDALTLDWSQLGSPVTTARYDRRGEETFASGGAAVENSAPSKLTHSGDF